MQLQKLPRPLILLVCKCSQSTKAKAYSSMVHPTLEYCSTVWDPHFLKDINDFEKVQRQAARWAMSDYSWSSSVTSMLEVLQWPTLYIKTTHVL